MSSTVVTPSMMLITGEWGKIPTFKMMPMTSECLFTEGIYDPQSKTLIMMTKIVKDSYHMLPKLDDNGDTVPSKKGGYKQQRALIPTFQEYYITDKTEIDEIVKMLAINSSFDHRQYLYPKVEAPQEIDPVLEPETNTEV